MRKASVLALSILVSAYFAGSALAQTHAPHEHGAATLNLAVENDGFEVEIDGALAGFLSFEHAPSTPEQEAEVKAMAAKFAQAGSLFKAPEAAGCQVESVSLSSENLPAELLAPYAAAGGHHHHDGDHDHEGEEGHHHDGEEGHHHEGEEGHANLEAVLEFKCAKVSALDSLTIGLFEAFSGLEELEAQVVTPKGQSAAELTKASPVLKW